MVFVLLAMELNPLGGCGDSKVFVILTVDLCSCVCKVIILLKYQDLEESLIIGNGGKTLRE
jgi:hypothetical protein